MTVVTEEADRQKALEAERKRNEKIAAEEEKRRQKDAGKE
jgi:hypothetical protein